MNKKKILRDGKNMDLSIYDSFVSDYNNPNMTGEDVRLKNGLNHHRYSEIRKIALENGDIPASRRMNRSDAKFYTKTSNGFVVKKQFGHSCLFVGRFATQDTAEAIVEKCKEVNWNIDEIREFIDQHKIKPKNYTCTSNGFTVQKVIDGKNRVICTVNNETTAQKIVEKFRECNWNIENMDSIISKVE